MRTVNSLVMTRNISRRLERLEQQSTSTDVCRYWQIVTIDSAGNLEHGTGHQFPSVPTEGFRPSHRPRKTRGR
jgi:hypothetical protein